MPNLRQLEYLVAVADTLNFRRAAERTHTTQPTLSEQLKALELRLGAQLVDRSRNHVQMTPLGLEVTEIARRVLADTAEIRAIAAEAGKGHGGVLRLGLPPTIGPYLVPRVIPELAIAFPGLKLYVREELPMRLPRDLEAGKHDCIITPLPIRANGLTYIPIAREPLHLVVPANHRLAGASAAVVSDLTGEDVLALAPGHQLHDMVQGLSEEFGARIRYDYEGTSLDTLREMIAMGLGISFLPGFFVASVVRRDVSLAIVPLKDRAVERVIAMAWRRASSQAKRYERLAKTVRGVVAREFEGFGVSD